MYQPQYGGPSEVLIIGPILYGTVAQYSSCGRTSLQTSEKLNMKKIYV